MKAPESLKEVERRAYRSTLNDGIYDLAFGFVFLILAWIPILEVAGVSRFVGYSLLIVFAALLPWLGKRFITIPRLGAVEFGTKRKSRKRLILAIGAAVLVLTLPVMIMIGKDDISGRLGWPMIGMFAAPLLVVTVMLLESPRLIVYASLLIAGIAEAEFLLSYVDSPLNALISFGIPGVIISAVGTTLLVKFIQKYPKTNSEVPHVVR